MIIAETVLITVLLCTMGCAAYVDFRTGLIPNRLLLISAVVTLAADIVYYGIFVRELLPVFLVNFFTTFVLALLLYIFHFWGAGDSKFVMVIVLAIPARVYANSYIALATLEITVYTFSIAFIYLIFESVILGIKQKNFFRFSGKPTLKSAVQIIKSYLMSYAYILLLNFMEIQLVRGSWANNRYLTPFLNFFIILTVFSFDFLKRWYVILIVTAADIALYSVFSGGISGYMPAPLNLLIITLVLVFRNLAEKYNYKTVPTSEITAGTVLSLSAVISFSGSRVHGLPSATTEDFRSRITADEADSIRRWENSKTGKHELVIVRKLPFAIFITLGTLLFMILRWCGR